jgi:hypothetical protein
MAFVPCDLVTIQVGRLSANVYPKNKPGIPNFERAHAFQVIKSTLEPIPIDTRLIFDVVGMKLNCSAIVKGLMFDWKNAFDMHWFDFANLTILSFHDSKGAIISNTTIANNPGVLLLIQAGTITDCRKGNVCFV